MPIIRWVSTSTSATRSCGPATARGSTIRRRRSSPASRAGHDHALPDRERLQEGHRIRVDVSSSNYPRFDVNPNTGDPLGDYRRMVPADNTVYHDAAIRRR